MISVVVLQSNMDPTDGNKFPAVGNEGLTGGTGEIPAGLTEPSVSCVPVVSVMHISYRLYPELPAPISVCPCEAKIDC